jgi:hypothetical protein
VRRQTSFDKIKLINDMLISMLGDTPDVPRVLVGSMVDLAEQRSVPVKPESNYTRPSVKT